MLAHALVMYTEPLPLPLPQSEPSDWKKRLFGDMPWCKSFDKVIPQKSNAEAPVKTFVLEADLPEEAEEDCLYPGDRMRFTHSVLNETALDDHLLLVLAVEEYKPLLRMYPCEFTDTAAKADSYSKTIVGFRTGGKSVNSGIIAMTNPAKRVLVQDLVDGNIYSVSPKLLRRDG